MFSSSNLVDMVHGSADQPEESIYFARLTLNLLKQPVGAGLKKANFDNSAGKWP